MNEQQRFIFRSQSGLSVNERVLSHFYSHSDVTIVDRSRRMLLVETTEQTAQQLAEELDPDFIYAPETTDFSVPTTQPTVKEPVA